MEYAAVDFTTSVDPRSLQAGASVGIRFRKHDGRRHWEYDVTVLGSDEAGVWTVLPPGSRYVRPGIRELANSVTTVVCVPWEDCWILHAYDQAEEQTQHTYVDITTPCRWHLDHGGMPCATTVDMDLDVIRFHSGEVVVDDEDEFAEHTVLFDYSPALVAVTRATCERVLQAVCANEGPFGPSAASWLTLAKELVSRP